VYDDVVNVRGTLWAVEYEDEPDGNEVKVVGR
jgi:membrane protein implicated in regulation of membrane protease activity